MKSCWESWLVPKFLAMTEGLQDLADFDGLVWFCFPQTSVAHSFKFVVCFFLLVPQGTGMKGTDNVPSVYVAWSFQRWRLSSTGWLTMSSLARTIIPWAFCSGEVVTFLLVHIIFTVFVTKWNVFSPWWMSICLFILSFFICLLFKNQRIQGHYKAVSAESHKVLKTVVSLGNSVDLTEGACFMYIFTGVLLAELPVCGALTCVCVRKWRAPQTRWKENWSVTLSKGIK